MRRMLTDKLTKSIKEVVNAYNEGEFSAVEANPASTTETLTGIEINGVGYAVSGGSGSVDIDNKTIIENADGELETAVGGYVKEQSFGYGPKLIGTQSDWDLVDSTLATTLYNMLDVNTQYDVNLGFVNCKPSQEIVSAYIESYDKTETRFGGNGALHITTVDENEYSWEFYVDISTNNIHIWNNNTLVTPVTGSNIIIDFGSESGLPEVLENVYHTIDLNYIPDVSSKLKLGYGLKYDTNDNNIQVDMVPSNKEDNCIMMSYYGNTMVPWVNFNIETLKISKDENNYNKLDTQIGGGYRSDILIDKNYIVYNSVLNIYDSTQVNLINAIENYIKLGIKKYYSNDIIAGNTITPWDITNKLRLYSNGNTTFPTFYLRVSVGNDGDTITCTMNSDYGTSGIGIDQLVYSYSTNITSTSISKVTFAYDEGQWIIVSHQNDDVMLISSDVELFNMLETVNPKFLPAFNVAPTVAGTYTLQATVDAQGNVTYAWVAQV